MHKDSSILNTLIMIVSRNDQDIAQKKTIKDNFVLVWFFNSPTSDSALIRKTPNKKTMSFLIKTVTRGPSSDSTATLTLL